MRVLPVLIGLWAHTVGCSCSSPTQPRLDACLVYDDSHNLVLEDMSGIRDSIEVPARVFMASSIEPGPKESALVVSPQRQRGGTYRDTIDVVDLPSGAVLDRWTGGEAVYSEASNHIAYVDASTYEVWVSPWPKGARPRSCGFSLRRERPWHYYRTVIPCGNGMFCFVADDARTLVTCTPSGTADPEVRRVADIDDWIPLAWRPRTRALLLLQEGKRVGEIALDEGARIRNIAESVDVPSTAIYVEPADALFWGTRGFMELPMRGWLPLTEASVPVVYRAPFIGDGFVISGSCPGGS